MGQLRRSDAFRFRLSMIREQPMVPILILGALAAGLILARLPLLDALVWTMVGLTLVGSWIDPLIGVGIVLFVAPFQAWLRAEVPGVPSAIGQGLFLAVVGVWGVRAWARRELRWPVPPFLGGVLLFMGAALLSLWNPADPWTGFMEWAKWAQILLMFGLVYERIAGPDGERRTKGLVAALLGAALFQAGVGLWQFGLRGTGPAHFAIDERFYRAYGTFEQPNPYAGLMGMVGAVGVGIVLAGGGDWLWTRWRKMASPFPRYLGVLIPVALGIAAALVASWSRGGWMGFGAAVLIMAVALPRRRSWGLGVGVLAIGGGWLLYQNGLLPDAIASRLTGFLEYTRFEDVRGAGITHANYAVLERMAHWQVALEMWRDHFWTGVGFGCYEPAYPRYALANWPIALGHAHNYYLNLLAETGLLGLSAYLVWLGALGARLSEALRRLQGWERGLALGLLGAWTHLAVHELVDYLLVNNVHLHIGVLLALSAWVVKQGWARMEEARRLPA